MQLIEKFLFGKKPDQSLCEDKLFFNHSFAAVFDGVTSKSDLLWDGKTGGIKATQILEDVLQNLPSDATADTFIQTATQKFHSTYTQAGLEERVFKTPSDRIQAVAVIYSAQRRELWFFGDCRATIDGQTVETPQLDCEEIYSAARALYLECELQAGKTIEELEKNDTGREYILPLIKKFLVFSNNPTSEYGYSVIDGFKIPESLISVIPVPQGEHQIILSSDGYPKVFPTLEQTEQHLKALLERDPMCFRENKRPKGLMQGYNSFDDRAYLRFSIN